MSRSRMLAVVMIITQVAAVYILHASIPFATVAVLAALIGGITPIHIPLKKRLSFWILVALAAVLLGKYIAQGERSDVMSHVLLGYTIGQILLIAQIGSLFVKRNEDRLPQLLPVYGILTFLCAGVTSAPDLRSTLFLINAIVFVIASALYLRAWTTPSESRHRSAGGFIRPLAASIAVVVVAGAMHTLLKQFQEDVEITASRILTTLSKRDRTGFSGGGGLEDILIQRLSASKDVALRVATSGHPGYMRGEAFVRYDDGGWEASELYRSPEVIDNPPDGFPVKVTSRTVYRLEHGTSGPWRVFTCRHPNMPGGYTFTPLKSNYLIVKSPGVEASSESIFRLSGRVNDEEYIAVVPLQTTIAPLSEHRKRRLTRVPSHLSVPLQSLVDTIFKDCDTTPQKIEAVRKYLQVNYQYRLGIDLPMDVDPLLHFLLEKPPAHCEYFASAAAILLRLADVPTRYVTGFVVNERDYATDSWLARNRDAHAWVEAYDESVGWTIVEATPPEGIPSLQPPPLSAMLMSRLYAFVNTVGLFLREDGYAWLSRSFVLLVALALLVLLWRFRKRLLPASSFVQDPAFAPYRKVLAKMDKRLKRRGLQRAPYETLHQFAERVGTEYGDDPQLCLDAQWYRMYAEARFGGKVTPEAVRWLLQAMNTN